MRTNWEMDEETRNKYYKELIHAMLSHNGETIEVFGKHWSLSLANNYYSIVYSYVEVCNEPYYEEKDREEAETWLRNRGLDRFINKVYAN